MFCLFIQHTLLFIYPTYSIVYSFKHTLLFIHSEGNSIVYSFRYTLLFIHSTWVTLLVCSFKYTPRFMSFDISYLLLFIHSSILYCLCHPEGILYCLFIQVYSIVYSCQRVTLLFIHSSIQRRCWIHSTYSIVYSSIQRTCWRLTYCLFIHQYSIVYSCRRVSYLFCLFKSYILYCLGGSNILYCLFKYTDIHVRG